MDDLPVIAIACLDEWEGWLEKNHASSPGIWLRIYKKDSGVNTVSYPEALDGALCYGWIDGQKKGGQTSWLQKFTPRRACRLIRLRDQVNTLDADVLWPTSGTRATQLRFERAGDGVIPPRRPEPLRVVVLQAHAQLCTAHVRPSAPTRWR